MPYIQNALTFIIETIVGLYLIAVILRFLFQLLRVDFRNPISQMIVTLTNAPLKFLRRFIPRLYGIDLASIVLILLVGLLKTGLLLTISRFDFNLPGAFVITLSEVLNTISWTLIIVILGSAILSWVAPTSHHPAARLLGDMSSPILRPFRRVLPPFSGIDLTPILALLALNLLRKLVVHPLTDVGRSFFI